MKFTRTGLLTPTPDELWKKADCVVLAQAGETIDDHDDTRGDCTLSKLILVKTSLRVILWMKGGGRDGTIRVSHLRDKESRYGIIPVEVNYAFFLKRLRPGDLYLLFLCRTSPLIYEPAGGMQYAAQSFPRVESDLPPV